MYFLLIAGILIGIIAGWIISRFLGINSLKKANDKSKEIIETAKLEAEAWTKETKMEVEDELYELRQTLEHEIEQDKEKFEDLSKELDQKEVDVEQREELLEKKSNEIYEKKERVCKKRK